MSRRWALGISLWTGLSLLTAAAFADSLTDESQWKTYRNTQYGFQIRYPKSMQLIDKSSNPDSDHNRLATPVVTNVIVYNTDDQDWPTVGVGIGVSSGKTLEEACNISDFSTYDKIVLNGNEFYADVFDFSGMGKWEEGYSYTAFHKGYCYNVFFTAHDSIYCDDDIRSCKEEHKLHEKTKYYYKIAEKIAKTFEFLP